MRQLTKTTIPCELSRSATCPTAHRAEVYPPYEALIAAINGRHPDLVIHVGDTKGGGSCTDKLLDRQLHYMNRFEAPVLYTPGDNEWTDCFNHSGGLDDPLERLAYIRKTYFAEPDLTLGRRSLPLQHQAAAGYPENARVIFRGIMFITAHIVGSNNNFETRDIKAVEEFFARSAASTAWLKESFAMAGEVEIVVVAIHADMFEFDFNEFGNESWLRHSGFGQFGTALQKAAAEFAKPVLLVFGDSHVHRVFQPFPAKAPNVTAVEVYGYPDMHAVEITIDPSADDPFHVATVLNPLRN